MKRLNHFSVDTDYFSITSAKGQKFKNMLTIIGMAKKMADAIGFVYHICLAG
jgi:hypothetical protein